MPTVLKMYDVDDNKRRQKIKVPKGSKILAVVYDEQQLTAITKVPKTHNNIFVYKTLLSFSAHDIIPDKERGRYLNALNISHNKLAGRTLHYYEKLGCQ